MSCGCHNLNIVLCGGEELFVKSVTSFGVLGGPYSLYSTSFNNEDLK